MVGDRWSLLIIRDMMFADFSSYREFLASGEGIATNILAARLDSLEAAGLIIGTPDPDDGRKRNYRLTAKGLALAPILVELSSWGMRFEGGTGPEEIVKEWKLDPDAFVAKLASRQRALPN
jgi:DNA-binding HxlR family transcriptional regulator